MHLYNFSLILSFCYIFKVGRDNPVKRSSETKRPSSVELLSEKMLTIAILVERELFDKVWMANHVSDSISVN